MKRLIFVITLFCTPAFGQGPPGMALHDWCVDHNQGAGDIGCMAYLRGFIDGAAMANGGRAADARICFPSGVTLGQVRLVVDKYMAANPDKLNQSASEIAYAALFLAFPCKTSN